jgi:2-keto-4-pentenoate hydratase
MTDETAPAGPGTTLDPTRVEELAAALHQARLTRTPIPPLTDSEPGMTLWDGYAVQQAIVRRLLEGGDRVVGYKLGLTSKPMQKMLGVGSPDFAPVLAGHVNGDGEDIAVDKFIAPRIEAEIAFVLGEDLTGPDCTAIEVLQATAGVAAALEIVDSRVADWKIKLPDTVADMASCGAIVLSGRVVPVTYFDVRLVGMVLTRNGEVVATGAGAAALGNPAAAIAWLVNTLYPAGITLAAGHVVMTGALHAAVPVAAGDVFRADFDRLGPVTARMV